MRSSQVRVCHWVILKTKILVLMEAVSCFVLVESQSVQAIADVSAADLTGSCKELLADCEMTAVVSVPIWQSGDWETVKQRLGSTVWEVEKTEDAAENYIGLSASGKPQAQGASAPDSSASKGNSFVGNADSIQLQGCQGMAAVGNRFFTAFCKSKGKNRICHTSSN